MAITALAVCIALGVQDSAAADQSSTRTPAGLPPAGILFFGLVAIGTAFAPDHWNGVLPLAALATFVFIVVLSALMAATGHPPAILQVPLTVSLQLMAGVFALIFVCLSIGLAIFRNLRRLF